MRIDKMSYNRNFGDKRKKIPKSNPFAKAVTVKEPYAIYLSPDRLTEYSVLQTYIHPNRENGDSEWLVAERTTTYAPLSDDYKLKYPNAKESYSLSGKYIKANQPEWQEELTAGEYVTI